MDDWKNGGFGLYVHWPFCEAKCPYCDFNSHVSASIDQDRWCNAYLKEIDRVAYELPGRVLNSIFFGGGTPSLMDPKIVAAILDRVVGYWPCANDLEVTLEANPSSVEADRFVGYRRAGVNRVSLGVQALNDNDLRRLGRLHSVEEARRAVAVAQAKFDRVSFALIYARQDQSIEDWRNELSIALEMSAGHLSLYQLTVEPGTAFGARHARGGLAGLPDEDLSADLYDVTQELCEVAGLPAYEISNHAADSSESRHNLIYWRGGDYAGIGPGAHGRITLDGTRYATETIMTPGGWLNAVEKNGSGEHERIRLTDDERAEEYLMMGLRLKEGCSLSRYRSLAGRSLNNGKRDELELLGLVEIEGDTFRTSKAGRPVLNGILRSLLA